ncbi:MAG TPA: hypothetical protein VMV72_08015 [Verrucomicrobiae bacterium]|nr:hypothetical protein [Verrucomicrobiae bacterium]
MFGMRGRLWLVGRLLIAITFISPFAHAQYTDNFQTNIVSGVTSNWSGNYFVGNTNFADALLIESGGVLADANAYLGQNSSSSNNSALVTGTGSVWNGSGLYVGYSGAGNGLVISKGGNVVSGNSIVGLYSSSNTVVITDSGSVWSNSGTLTFGYWGANNTLVIDNDGGLVSSNCYVGYNVWSCGNSVLVSGSGSVWSNGGNFYLGLNGAGNSLVISNGGAVDSSSGGNYTFVGSSSSASSNNSVLVTGVGSVWSISGSMSLGWGAASNSLVVEDGGQVIAATATVGSDHSGTNSVLITGANSVWSNSGTLHIGAGAGSGNSVIISNGARMVAGTAYLGSHSNNNKVRVVDGGAWENAELFIGLVASGDLLVVDGGSVSASSQLFIGPGGSCDNVAELDNGSITVTNRTGTAALEVVTGQVIMNGGVLRVDSLIVNGVCARFFHYGGTLIYRNLELDPALSAVGDGIPNDWKQQYGLDPLDPNLANKDVAGTGFTVLQDYLAGVDPTNPAAAFRITSVVPQTNDLLVTWTMGPNRTNALQAAAGDVNGGYNTNSFADIFTVTNTVGTVTNYLDAGAATNVPSRYYRVRLVP